MATDDPLSHLPPHPGPTPEPEGHPRSTTGGDPVAPTRFPYLRAKLLQVCTNRAEVESLFDAEPLHPAERKIHDWGRLSAVEALRAYPDKDDSVRRNLHTMEEDLWRREVEDTAEYAFSLLSPIVEWRLETGAGRVVLLVEDHPIDPGTGEYDYGRVRHRTIALPLDASSGSDLAVELLGEEHYVVEGVDPERVEKAGPKPTFDPSCMGGDDLPDSGDAPHGDAPHDDASDDDAPRGEVPGDDHALPDEPRAGR